jgi:predicted dehydrogenase
MANGAPAVAQIQGGSDGATASMIELRGTAGSLRISTLQPKQLQMSALGLEGARGSGDYSSLAPPVRFTAHLPAGLRMTPAENVAGIYDAIAAAIEDGADSPADFGVALERHRLIEAVERSSADGTWEAVAAGTVAR